MSTNKNANTRYQVLNKCFRNPGKKYFIEDLVEECNKRLFELSDISNGVNKRQIYYDISYMEMEAGYNANILRLKEGRRKYYRYEDISFDINNQGFNEMEANQIKEALQTLSRFNGLPQFEWISEIITKIDSGFNLSNNDHNIIEFDQNKYLKGLNHITDLYNFILYKKVIKIIYQSFKTEKEQIFKIHPYFLKQYNNRWFLFGINDDSKRIINLALDRIEDIKETKEKYLDNNQINFSEYFEDVIGVSIDTNKKIEKILLSVSNTLLPYIETKPLHGSQKIIERKEETTSISIEVIPNYELESLLLSFGEKLTVLKPVDFREQFVERIKKMYNIY